MNRVRNFVSPEAAIELSAHRDIDDMRIASEIYNAALNHFTDIYEGFEFAKSSAIAALWNAGRIQGIKEERWNRKYKPNTDSQSREIKALIKQFVEELEQYSVAMERLMNNIDLAVNMIGDVTCGQYMPDDEETLNYLCSIEALMDSISEIAHKRNDDCNNLSKMLLKISK